MRESPNGTMHKIKYDEDEKGQDTANGLINTGRKEAKRSSKMSDEYEGVGNAVPGRERGREENWSRRPGGSVGLSWP